MSRTFAIQNSEETPPTEVHWSDDNCKKKFLVYSWNYSSSSCSFPGGFQSQEGSGRAHKLRFLWTNNAETDTQKHDLNFYRANVPRCRAEERSEENKWKNHSTCGSDAIFTKITSFTISMLWCDIYKGYNFTIWLFWCGIYKGYKFHYLSVLMRYLSKVTTFIISVLWCDILKVKTFTASAQPLDFNLESPLLKLTYFYSHSIDLLTTAADEWETSNLSRIHGHNNYLHLLP